MDINEIRKYFYESNDYVIRIRNDNDIVYYHGIKVFTIKNDSIELSEKIFNVNKRIFEKYENATAEALKNIREKIKGFLAVKGNANIAFNESDSEAYSKKAKENAIKEIEGKIRGNKDLNKYFEFVKDKYTLKLIQKCEPDELAEIECSVLEYFVFDYAHRGWKKPTFNLFEAKTKLNKLYINNGRLVLGKNGNIDITDKAVQEAVKMYETYAYEAEKNYQHLFMTDEKIKYKADEFKDILRFEEEYSIKGGRVDNIFLKFNCNAPANLYLIELKYGSSVIDGSNGVKKHLEDIKVLMNNRDKLDEIRENINYRLRWINANTSSEYIEINTFNNVNFWIVIGYADKDEKLSKKSVEQKLKEINKKGEISNLIKELEQLDCGVKIFLDETEFSADKISLTDAEFEPWLYD